MASNDMTEVRALYRILERYSLSRIILISTTDYDSLSLVAQFECYRTYMESNVVVEDALAFDMRVHSRADINASLSVFASHPSAYGSHVFVLLTGQSDAAVILDVASGAGLNCSSTHFWIGSSAATLAALDRRDDAFSGMLGLQFGPSTYTSPTAQDYSSIMEDFVWHWRSIVYPGWTTLAPSTRATRPPSSLPAPGSRNFSNFWLPMLTRELPGFAVTDRPTVSSVPASQLVPDESARLALQAADAELYKRTGRWGWIDSSTALMLDSILTVALSIRLATDESLKLSGLSTSSTPVTASAVLQQMRRASFVGASGLVSFSINQRVSARVLVVSVTSTTLVYRCLYNGTALDSWANSTIPWPVGGQPSIAPSTTTTTTAKPEVPCLPCSETIALPIVVGAYVFLAIVSVVLFFGCKRIGTALFEQTAMAEQSAEVCDGMVLIAVSILLIRGTA